MEVAAEAGVDLLWVGEAGWGGPGWVVDPDLVPEVHGGVLEVPGSSSLSFICRYTKHPGVNTKSGIINNA